MFNLWWLAVIAGVLMLFKVKGVPSFGKYSQLFGFIVCLVGLFQLGILGSLSAGAATTSGAVVLDRMTVGGGLVNVTDDADFYNADDTELTLYMDDADISDNEYIYWNLTMERSNVEKAGSVEVECVFYTEFQSAGATENMVSLDSDNEYEINIDSAGTIVGNRVKKTIPFAEADEEQEVEIRARIDETDQDKLVTKDSLPIVCSAGGKSVTVNAVAND